MERAERKAYSASSRAENTRTAGGWNRDPSRRSCFEDLEQVLKGDREAASCESRI